MSIDIIVWRWRRIRSAVKCLRSRPRACGDRRRVCAGVVPRRSPRGLAPREKWSMHINLSMMSSTDEKVTL